MWRTSCPSPTAAPSTAVEGARGLRSIPLRGQYPMRPLKLAEVRKHTGRQLTYAEAITPANPGDPFLRNMAVALSLHTWNNTAQDWLRLERLVVALRNKIISRGRWGITKIILKATQPDKAAGSATAEERA